MLKFMYFSIRKHKLKKVKRITKTLNRYHNDGSYKVNKN